ncbi:hypothetical protein GXW82_09105 [Streptacidiphilus sp. 4-A2]|nr:hypothetical protein [Streptacidiphilus sp. 4-A2]
MAGGVLNTFMEIGPALGLAGFASAAAEHSLHLRATGSAPGAATAGGYSFALAVAGILFAVSGVAALVRRSAAERADPGR